MPYKIAVGSGDRKSVDQHFGMSEGFVIYDVDDRGGYHFSEYRKTSPACGVGERHDSAMQNSVAALSDCRIVLVSQIGPCAERELSASGVQFMTVSGNIDQVLPKLIAFLKRQKYEIKNKGNQVRMNAQEARHGEEN